jgi:hypothetical protein
MEMKHKDLYDRLVGHEVVRVFRLSLVSDSSISPQPDVVVLVTSSGLRFEIIARQGEVLVKELSPGEDFSLDFSLEPGEHLEASDTGLWTMVPFVVDDFLEFTAGDGNERFVVAMVLLEERKMKLLMCTETDEVELLESQQELMLRIGDMIFDYGVVEGRRWTSGVPVKNDRSY